MLIYLIILVTCQSAMFLPSYSEFNEYSYVTNDQTTKKWKDGKIPFEIVGDFSIRDRQLIVTAMNVLHKHTCIRFQHRSYTDVDYISFDKRHIACNADVGRQGGKQIIKIILCPINIGNILRKLLQTIGLQYEHNRWDRDSFLDIKWENINEADQYLLGKRNELEYYEQEVHYDLNSLLHCSKYCLTNNKSETIIPRVNGSRMGQNDGLSRGDIKRVNLMYNCTKENIYTNYRLPYEGFTGNPTDKDLLDGLEVIVPWLAPNGNESPSFSEENKNPPYFITLIIHCKRSL